MPSSSSILNARTTNAAESFHSKLNKLAGRPHLNIYEMIEVLQSIQQETEIEIARLMSGGKPIMSRLKYRELDLKIKRLKGSLDASTISLTDYMTFVSECFHI